MSFAPMKPTERWLHRTTAVKIRVEATNVNFRIRNKFSYVLESCTKSSSK